MEITRVGSQPSAKGPDDLFTGTVRIDSRFQRVDPARIGGAVVTFEPGARTAWHTHPLGQTLIVTAGCGWVQRDGGTVEESARVMSADSRERYNQVARREWAGYDWSPSADIYTYFWTHATTLLRQDGTLALITQSAWLDVEYGIPIQAWMLSNFRIVAVMESEAEPWFTDARVATAVTVLRRETDSAF
jgi:hypothetical protein